MIAKEHKMSIVVRLIDGAEIAAVKGKVVVINGVRVFSVTDFTLSKDKSEQLKSSTEALHIPITSIVWWKHPVSPK